MLPPHLAGGDLRLSRVRPLIVTYAEFMNKRACREIFKNKTRGKAYSVQSYGLLLDGLVNLHCDG